jgi:hypothetical protein
VGLTARVDEGKDLFADVLVEHPLTPAAVERMRAAVEERLVVVRADAEDLHAPGVDVLADRVDEALPLELPLVALARRKGEQRRTPVPEDRDAHVVLEPR